MSKLNQAIAQLQAAGAYCPTIYAHLPDVEQLRALAMMAGVEVASRWGTALEGVSLCIIETFEQDVEGVRIHVSAYRAPTLRDWDAKHAAERDALDPKIARFGSES